MSTPESRNDSEAGIRLERPVFIVAPPCAGGELLGEALAAGTEGRTVPGGFDAVLAEFPVLHTAARGSDSDRLTGSDLTPDLAERVRAGLLAALAAEEGGAEPGALRLIDAAAANALRIPLLAALFPRSTFVYLHREPRPTLAAMLAAWESGESVTHPELPGWEGAPWSLPLTPQWRGLADASPAEIVADQWRQTMRLMLADLDRLPAERWCVVDRDALVAASAPEIERVADFAGLAWERERVPAELAAAPVVERDDDLEPVLGSTAELAAAARDLIARPVPVPGEDEPAPDFNSPIESPLRSVNSSNLPDILGQLGSSLLVSTYQTGKVVCVRRDGAALNTHFRRFDSPMGMAWRGGRLAIGSKAQVHEYHDVPAVAAKLEPAGKHDSCFVPRRSHYTGDIRIHDVAFAGDGFWFVATRFSCLATLDANHSFVPRWRPPFITALAAEDRCHLNGLCVVDDEVRYVTALGTTDVAGGWRENKARGGVVMDVRSNEIVASGLSMPHSPRWYRDRLWVLESGEGAIGHVDVETGAVETVAKLPGFTRGLTFAGPLAFVGLSEVRESTTFGGLPLTGRLEERQCGVWVVNIETGQTVAMLRFEDLVQEIFEVLLLPGIAFPEIAEPSSTAAETTYVVPDAMLR